MFINLFILLINTKIKINKKIKFFQFYTQIIEYIKKGGSRND